jgi:hypothetical protein
LLLAPNLSRPCHPIEALVENGRMSLYMRHYHDIMIT